MIVDKFIQQLEASGLLPPQQLAELAGSDTTQLSTEDLAAQLVKRELLTPYQASEMLAERGRGLQFGNYVVQGKLGQGGMGLVLKAEHRLMKRPVAIKVILPHAQAAPELVLRFRREVEAIAQLSHPNIVVAHDAGEADGGLFLVMEYVAGTDLASLVKKSGPFPLPQVLALIDQAAAGLEYAHQKGIVHRDIKPANLLLDQHGTLKVLDLGLARFTGQDFSLQELTGTGLAMGTVDFMAPEQAANSKQADHRADVYSLGATLWYLATGRALYKGENVIETIVAHRTEPIPSLALHCPAAPPRLQFVLNKMVAKQPADRYQSMAACRTDLQRCLSEVHQVRSAPQLLQTRGSPWLPPGPFPPEPAPIAPHESTDSDAGSTSDTVRTEHAEQFTAQPADTNSAFSPAEIADHAELDPEESAARYTEDQLPFENWKKSYLPFLALLAVIGLIIFASLSHPAVSQITGSWHYLDSLLHDISRVVFCLVTMVGIVFLLIGLPTLFRAPAKTSSPAEAPPGPVTPSRMLRNVRALLFVIVPIIGIVGLILFLLTLAEMLR